MSQTLSEITMDDTGTVRETAHALAMLAAIPEECDEETQVRNWDPLYGSRFCLCRSTRLVFFFLLACLSQTEYSCSFLFFFHSCD